ncbi:DcuS/MalK family sensor histidine kinase [Calidifontibacillus erzurumensis]|uniref:histidine kinase n=1 Tax=Calidifontibacillus erzurumensis TaxID=2741433 RepID=A0A8J8GFH7_9BACI|nr:DcuS/MalK family sensor histidine kinase [Calidifontibacillus erzurumensis]NSL52529.1 two-component system sensor histidine kinase DcuS [Calidifontibacillus erzurumensis]
MTLRRLKLSTVITGLVCLVVLLSLLITDLLITPTITERVKGNLEERAVILSKIVAQSPVVINGLKNKEQEGGIQHYATKIVESSNVLFVVVMDMNGIRKSHPNPNLIGKKFVGGDEKDVLKEGKHYVSISRGTLGLSLRAFTPIYDEENIQIGAVSVGISLEKVDEAVDQVRNKIIIGTIIGLIVGIFGAYVVAEYIKTTLFGLEPMAIAKIYEERNTMLQSVHEGIIAVDQNSVITLVNKSANRLFQKAGLSDVAIGMSIHDYLPSFALDHVLQSGQPELDVEYRMNGVTILVNKVPLIVNGEVVGGIATFRDKTEINKLAEQLTGVKTYAEALRAQSHEFMNKLHVILGMVNMGMYEQLTDFIRKLVHHRFHEGDHVAKMIKDPALAGFVMGKLSYAREANVQLKIETNTVIPEPKNSTLIHEIITILGNLIDNAIEAMEEMKENTIKEIKVSLHLEDHLLKINVSDTGPGISDELIDRIFEKGFSTKGENRGYGLYLVKNSVERLNGDLRMDSDSKKGTTITVVIPFETKKGE